MAYRPLEITLISAKDLSNVNLFTKMEVYAVAKISGDKRSKQKSPVDREGGKNPNWNATIKFNVLEFDADRAVVYVLLRSERALGDRDIGEVHVPIRELLDGWNRAMAAGPASSNGEGKKSGPGAQFVSYQVRKQSGRAKGVLNLSYKFGDLVTNPTPRPPQMTMDPAMAYSGGPPAGYPPSDACKGHEPVTAYPVAAGASTAYPPPQGGYAYPPPAQGGYGYPPPPQAGYGYPPPGSYPPQQGAYGYPPQQGAYGYPPQGYGYGGPPPVMQQQQQGKKKSKFGGAGMGLGAGLLGGALGGMILGDMVSDAGDYSAGYDAGFDDGFDF